MNIPIVFACDNQYAMPTAVAIRSLIGSKHSTSSYDIHVLGNALDADHRRRLESMARADAPIQVHDVADPYKGRIAQRTHVTTTALYLFDVGVLLPQYNRVIYLDGDIIVNGDLRSLFETPLEGCYAVAVKQMNIAELPPMEGGGTPQFYSGVLVLDTARMREENIREKLFDAIQDLGVGCHDQVAFNLVFGSQVKLVNPTYNYCNVNDMLCSPDEACRHYGLGLDEWKRAQRNPVILHFIDGKPWNQRFCLRERAWVRAFRKSPYADISLKRKTSMKVLLIWMLNALLPAGIGRSTLRRLFVRFFKKDW